MMVVAAKPKGRLEGIMMAMLDALVQNSDNLKIVGIRILVSNELAMMGQEVQGLDGQVMGVAEMLLIPLQNLDIYLDHLLMSMMLLIELD
jgi:hypothetical protein